MIPIGIDGSDTNLLNRNIIAFSGGIYVGHSNRIRVRICGNRGNIHLPIPCGSSTGACRKNIRRTEGGISGDATCIQAADEPGRSGNGHGIR